jgi:hypothetical protein
MKAKFIYEKLDFERGIDPKEAMNVGRIQRGKLRDRSEEENEEDFKKAIYFLADNFDLKKWTIAEGSTDRYKSIHIRRRPLRGTYDEFVIMAPKESDDEEKQLEIIGYLYSTSMSWQMKTLWKNEDPYITWVDMAQKLAEIINSNPKLPKTEFFKKPAEWEDRFNESQNFERGLDPKDSLKLGIRNKRSFKTVRECAQFFIDNIDKLSEGRFKNPEDLKRAFQDQKYANERTDDPNPQINKSPLRMSKDYLDGFIERDALGNTIEHKYPPIYTEEWGTDFHHVLQKLASLRDFHIDLQKILGIHKEGMIKESQNFERGIDPKAAMDIGWKAKVIHWFNEPHAFEDFYNGFYDLFPKKIKRFTTDHWLIKSIASYVGHSGKNEITPDQFTDLLAIILYSNAGKDTDEVFKFSKYGDINDYDSIVRDGHLDSKIDDWFEDGALTDLNKFKKKLEAFPNDMYEDVQYEEEKAVEEEKTNKRISN